MQNRLMHNINIGQRRIKFILRTLTFTFNGNCGIRNELLNEESLIVLIIVKNPPVRFQRKVTSAN